MELKHTPVMKVSASNEASIYSVKDVYFITQQQCSGVEVLVRLSLTRDTFFFSNHNMLNVTLCPPVWAIFGIPPDGLRLMLAAT